jgi:hypothetical protein
MFYLMLGERFGKLKRHTICARLDIFGWTIGEALGFEARKNPPQRQITHGLATRTLNEWARETGINRTTISQRLDAYGWTTGQALGFEPRV